MTPKKKFYITTPIYYVNARPHIGHVYTTTLADIIARYHRQRGADVFFLTGTDEHGKKVADAAHDRGLTPQQFVDQIAGEFESTFERFQFTHNDFIRTTQPRHESRVQQYVKQLIDRDDIYLGEYEGWYDQGQEEYITETNARDQNYKSAVSGQPLAKVQENNYFFRLSKYQDQLAEYIQENPKFIQPEARRNEVLARINAGLNDVAISRTTEAWGVPMPTDESHSIYVWIDALFNYVTTIDADDCNHYWPADVHLIGKEILWFHAVIWPAILLALDRPIYKQLYAHSFWIHEGQKMSKTLGNFIDLSKLDDYVNEFGLDALRYYLATQGPIGTSDADFAHEKFASVYNADLANTIGNCTNRVCNMTNRYFGGILPEHGAHVKESETYNQTAKKCVAQYVDAMSQFQLDAAAASALQLVRAIDGYIDKTQPFKLAKQAENMPMVGTILYNCAEALRIASLLLWPFLPIKIEQLWKQLGCQEYVDAVENQGLGDFENWTQWGQLQPGTPILQADPLFPRKK